MEIPFNFALALALIAAAVLVVATSGWLRERIGHHEILRTISVALALLLAPANLVFAFTGNLSVFNAVVMTMSVVALGVQAALAYQWRLARVADDVDDVTESLPVLPHDLRVLAVGVDTSDLDDAGLEVFSRAGNEVFALAIGDATPTTVAAAERTIIVGLPREHLPALGARITEAVAGHVHQLRPDLVLVPADGGPAREALRNAVGRVPHPAPVLLYPGDDVARAEPTIRQQLEHTVDWQFRPHGTIDDDTGRVTMPSFAR